MEIDASVKNKKASSNLVKYGRIKGIAMRNGFRLLALGRSIFLVFDFAMLLFN
jgi:hypothetical protein